MNKARLTVLLYELGVPSTMYRLDGSHSELAHVLAKEDDGWVVFLSERAGRSSPIAFDDEHEACDHLFGQICLGLAASGRLTVT